MVYQQYINGKLVEGQGDLMEVHCPANGELVGTVRAASLEQTREALRGAKEAFRPWANLPVNERIAWYQKLKQGMDARRDEIAGLLSREVGKPLALAKAEVYRQIDQIFDYYMGEAAHIYGETITDLDGAAGSVLHVIEKYPVGVTVGHMPWNYPISCANTKIGPALLTGCTCIIKPSSKCPLSTLLIGEVAAEIGLPAGVLNILCGPSAVVAKELNESTIPGMISLIGAAETGRQIVQESATSIKVLSFELGGNAPMIVMPDADIDEAARYVANGKCTFAGQGCGTVNRAYVHEDVHDAFVEAVARYMQEWKVGFGTEAGVCGPVIDYAARDRLLKLIEEAADQGAKVICGGKAPEGEAYQNGSYLLPTLLDHVTKEMRIVHEELFGPVLPVVTFSDFDDMLAQANDTEYGLNSYLFSHDSKVIGRCLHELDFGQVFVNNPPPRANLPHCGIKESGIGCTSSKYSLEEFFRMKRFSIKP